MDKQIMLLPGSAVIVGEPQTAVIPEVLNLEDGSAVELINDKGESLGFAEIAFSKVEYFAQLQKEDFYGSSHVEMQSWSNAYNHLLRSLEGFSQLDKVTVVTYVPTALVTPGLSIAETPIVVEDSDVDVEEFIVATNE